MANVTVSLPDELKQAMDQYPDVNWSEVARNAFTQYMTARRSRFAPIELSVDSLSFANDREGNPVIRVETSFTNKSDGALIVEGVIISAELGQISISSQYKLEKFELNKDAQVRRTINLKIDLFQAVWLFKNIKASYRCEISLSAYCQGYITPTLCKYNEKITIEEWTENAKRFIEPSLKKFARAFADLLDMK